jgi:hypothetical protein
MVPKKEREKLKVIKVPLGYKPKDHKPNFKPFPKLYLELLENKLKVKPELRDKEYVPKGGVSDSFLKGLQKSSGSSKNPGSGRAEPDKKKELLDFSKYDDEKKEDEKKEKTTIRERVEENLRKDRDTKQEEDKTKYSRSRKEKSRRSASKRSVHRTHKKRSSSRDDSYDSRRERRSRYSRRRHKESRKKIDDPQKKSSFEKRFDDILGKKDDPTEKKDDRTEEKTKEKSSDGDKKSGLPELPKLSDIEKGNVQYKLNNGVEVKDISTQPSDEEEARKKRELLFRFDILKRSYKGYTIPEYSEHTDLQTLEKSYEDTIRRLSLDSNVDNFKKYLIYGFMAMEWILGNWMGFDMKGFTQQQIVSMSSYERLLIELGEKSYLSGPSGWCVEIRLLALIVFNAAFFIVSKVIANKIGENFMNMMNGSGSTPTQQPQQFASDVNKKKKMRGPDINLDDLKPIGKVA